MSERAATDEDPHWSPEQFVAFYCETFRCPEDVMVTRIETRYGEEGDAGWERAQSLSTLGSRVVPAI